MFEFEFVNCVQPKAIKVGRMELDGNLRAGVFCLAYFFGLKTVLYHKMAPILTFRFLWLLSEKTEIAAMYLVNSWRPIDGVQASKDVLDCPLDSNFFYKQEYHCESQRLSPECNLW